MKLVFNNVSFAYAEKQVICNFSLKIGDGEHIVLSGTSGAGKTTLLRLACGLEKPDAGSVTGYPATAAYVFQENRLVPGMTVLENAAIAGDRAAAETILRELGLAGELGTFPDALSGGMARRVAIARALTHNSPLLLLDEPFTGLDEAARTAAAECILRHAAGRTILAVTHSAEEAALLGARVLRL